MTITTARQTLAALLCAFLGSHNFREEDAAMNHNAQAESGIAKVIASHAEKGKSSSEEEKEEKDSSMDSLIKDLSETIVDEDYNGCTLMAKVCESPAEITKEKFIECCKGAEWFCKDGNCHHAHGACSAAAEELYKDEELDCDGAADLLQYHKDHAQHDEKKAEALLERKQASTAMEGAVNGKARRRYCERW